MEEMKGIETFTEAMRMLTGGFQPGELITIGARTGMGKTCLGIQAAQEFASKGKKVCIISLEEKEQQVLKIIEAQRGDASIESLKNKKFDPVDNITIHDYLSWKENCHCWECFCIISTDGNKYSYKDFESYDLILIDCLQLINTSDTQNSRYLELERILTSMKRIAMILDTVIVLTSQLSRKVEERQGHRPILTDLRDSGVIEDISDKVIFILRREFYDPMDRPGCAEIMLAKNRYGPLGNMDFIFRKEHLDFTEGRI